jgi:hypothetical protein
MKVRHIALALALAASVPVTSTISAWAQDLSPGANAPATDTQANIDVAKDRMEKAKVRLDIAHKQVDAAKARLKAADAEFKAARATFEARNLEHHARKLSDASGLPEISEGQIEQGRTRSLALKQPAAETSKEESAAQPVDLSKTRLKQVDFNAQPAEAESVPAQAAPQESAPAPNPDKQAQVDSGFGGGLPLAAAPPQVAATAPASTEQPPIVP